MVSDINSLQSKSKTRDRYWWLEDCVRSRHPSSWVDDYLRKTIRISRGRNRARRELSYTITVEFMVALAEAQDYRCAVSGIEFQRNAIWQRFKRSPFSPSVDRIDCEAGYDPGNVRLVCLIVNLARGDFGDEALIQMAHAIAAAHPIKSPSLVPQDGG